MDDPGEPKLNQIRAGILNRKRDSKTTEKLERAYAAAMRRKDVADRPREGWRLTEITPSQSWSRVVRHGVVNGKPRGGEWRYYARNGEELIQGTEAHLGAAMLAAEEAARDQPAAKEADEAP